MCRDGWERHVKWNKGEKVNSISCFTEGAKTSLFRCPVGYGSGWPPTSQLHQHGRGNAAACSVRLFLKLNNALAPEVSPTDSPHRGTSGMSQVKSTSTTYLPCTHDGSERSFPLALKYWGQSPAHQNETSSTYISQLLEAGR